MPCKEGKVTPQGKLASSSSFGLKLTAVQPSMEHHFSELIDYMYLYELTYTCAMCSFQDIASFVRTLLDKFAKLEGKLSKLDDKVDKLLLQPTQSSSYPFGGSEVIKVPQAMCLTKFIFHCIRASTTEMGDPKQEDGRRRTASLFL